MEANKKFKLKRKCKTLMRLAYFCLAFFFIFLTTAIIIRQHSTADWNNFRTLLILISGIIGPIFIGPLLLIFAGVYQQELYTYLRDIKIYRSRVSASKIIEFLKIGETEKAIEEFRGNVYPEKKLDDYLYGLIIMSCFDSKDDKLHNKGIQKIQDIKKTFDPEVIFKIG